MGLSKGLTMVTADVKPGRAPLGPRKASCPDFHQPEVLSALGIRYRLETISLKKKEKNTCGH